MGRLTAWAGALTPPGAPRLPTHGRFLPVPCCGKTACQVYLHRQTSPGLRFSHLLAGPKVSSQSISSPRYLNSTGSYAALVASAEKQHQALSNLERELVRAGSTRANTEGGPAALLRLGT